MPTRDLPLLRDRGDLGLARLAGVLDALPARVYVWDRDLCFRYANAAGVQHMRIAGRDLRGQPMVAFVGPESVAAQRTHLDRALAGEPQTYQRTAVRRGAIAVREEEVTLEPIRIDEEVTGLLMIVLDRTDLLHAQQEAAMLDVDAAIRRDRLKLAFAVDAEVHGELAVAAGHLERALGDTGPGRDGAVERAGATLDDIIRRLREHILVLRSPLPAPPPSTPTERVLHVGLRPPRSAPMTLEPPTLTTAQLTAILDLLPVAVTAWSPQYVNEYANATAREWYAGGADIEGLPCDEILDEAAFESSLPLWEAALAGEPQEFVRSGTFGGRPRHERVDYIGQRSRRGPIGLVALVQDITDEIEADKVLRASAREDAVQQDHTRIAEDIHDLVIQSLFAAGLLIARTPDDGRLRDALASIAVAQEHLRSAILDVNSGSNPLLDLAATVEHAVAEVAKGATLRVSIEVSGPRLALPAPLAWEVAAVATEAVSNALRHSGGRQVAVTVELTAQRLWLTVTDDGRGLGSPRRSSGLANMAARAERHGGTLTFPHRRSGTRLEWCIPLV